MTLGELIRELIELETKVGAECDVVLYNSQELEEFDIEQVYEAGLEEANMPAVVAISFNDR